MPVYVGDITFTTTLVAHTCGECGIPFGMSREFYDKRQNDHKTFYCPNGHPRYFTGETDADRLRQQLDTARRDAEWQRKQRVVQERKNRALRGELTKTKKRVGNGVCPCCNRTFENLARHMAGQHPEYSKTEASAS